MIKNIFHGLIFFIILLFKSKYFNYNHIDKINILICNLTII